MDRPDSAPAFPCRPKRRSHRGVTLIETMVALVVLLIGLLGFAGLQIVAARTNAFNQRMAQGTALAMDLAENVKRWPYEDARLASLETVTSVEDDKVKDRADMGSSAATKVTAQFAEYADDSNATNKGMLATGYQGIGADVDGDGQTEFFRYWNVYDVDFNNTGVANGRLVQIIVRWNEGGYFRQVSTSTFKPNPKSFTR